MSPGQINEHTTSFTATLATLPKTIRAGLTAFAEPGLDTRLVRRFKADETSSRHINNKLLLPAFGSPVRSLSPSQIQIH